MVRGATMTAPVEPAPWSHPRRVAFRFAFAYLVLYCFPVPEGLADLPFNPVEKGWHAVVPWVGAHVLHLATPISLQETGSGDTTYCFVKLLCTAVLAVLATLVWTVLDRRRTDYATLHGWLRVYLRYALAMVMFGYGLIKVADLQFLFPPGDRLVEPYGDSSPMGLMWTFMGYSRAYQTFAGTAEVLGGLLLLSRRTATLGALVVAAVMTNVAMMNYCYDVPVKLGSTHLVLIAGFLLAPDLGRLARFFVLNRPTEPAPLGPVLAKRWQKRARVVLKVLFVAYVVGANGLEVAEGRKEFGPGAPHNAWEGVYDVEGLVQGGDAAPRWRRVVFFGGGFAKAQQMDGTPFWFRYADDAAGATLTLKKGGAPGTQPTTLGTLHYARPEANVVTLSGTVGGDALEVRLKKIDTSKMTLVTRGFHWVQEYPFNR